MCVWGWVWVWVHAVSVGAVCVCVGREGEHRHSTGTAKQIPLSPSLLFSFSPPFHQQQTPTHTYPTHTPTHIPHTNTHTACMHPLVILHSRTHWCYIRARVCRQLPFAPLFAPPHDTQRHRVSLHVRKFAMCCAHSRPPLTPVRERGGTDRKKTEQQREVTAASCMRHTVMYGQWRTGAPALPALTPPILHLNQPKRKSNLH